MASQDARLSKFEVDFKQQQSEMTNKIDAVLKAITDRIARALPSDTVKNPKLSASPVLSVPTISQASLLQTRKGIKPQQPKEPEPTLEDEFQDLHLNLPVLKVLAHAPIYKAILDKYVKSLELGKNGSAFFQGKVPAKMEDPGLFTLPCRLGDSKPFDTLADLDHPDGTKSYPVGIVKNVEVHIGKLKLLNDLYVIDMKKDPETPLLVRKGFLATANAVIDCRMAKIVVGEGITRSVFGVKGVDLGEEEAPYWTTLGKRKSYKPRPEHGWKKAHETPIMLGSILDIITQSRDYGLADSRERKWEVLVVSEQDELPSSVELEFRARLDDSRMYSGHLEAMRLP
ncbi:hypothetical protein Tco_1561790 [Tanacetum coccineum]